MKIAFIHEWLTTYGGSEQVLEAMLELWPQAPVYTLVADPGGQCRHIIENREVHTSFIAKLPNAKKWYRNYLPFMPLAVEQFDLRDYDIVISCSHAVAHGVLTTPEQLHINYICIPIRYAWHLYFQYLEESGLNKGIKGWLARIGLHYLRVWDTSTINRVDQYIAISKWVAKNVAHTYRSPSHVIYPPVNINDFELCERKENFYLAASRLVPYKKMDIIVDSFKHLPNSKLVVIGDGPEFEKIKANAPQNVDFLGYQPFEKLKEKMQKSKAFIFAAEEDFGIVPIEAQACGTPVIAYGKGGALETVIEGETGIFFKEQTAKSLKEAIEKFEGLDTAWNSQKIRENAERFSKERFQREFQQFVQKSWKNF
jgi:glycosyltransferase involved in cell wall biosynthesis